MKCHRQQVEGLALDCPAAYTTLNLELWCPACRAEYDRWCDEQAEQARLDAQCDGHPAWSYEDLYNSIVEPN